MIEPGTQLPTSTEARWGTHLRTRRILRRGRRPRIGFQIYATQGEAAVNVSALDHVITPVLGEIGRWQILDPALASENAVRFRQEQLSQRRQPGQELWDVCVGVRGVGDAIVLGEEVFHAVERAGLRFEQMSQIVFTNGYQETAFEKYSELADFPNR
jgi:hypothetical protein